MSINITSQVKHSQISKAKKWLVQTQSQRDQRCFVTQSSRFGNHQGVQQPAIEQCAGECSSSVFPSSSTSQLSEQYAKCQSSGNHDINQRFAGNQKLILGLLVSTCIAFATPNEMHAIAIHDEPSNALSFPTWVIHTSSVIEWTVAMVLVWRYADVCKVQQWKGLTWGMVPLLGGAFAACTWHFFYNSPQLEWLVLLQSSLTMIGNGTMAFAAYRIFKAQQAASSSSS